MNGSKHATDTVRSPPFNRASRLVHRFGNAAQKRYGFFSCFLIKQIDFGNSTFRITTRNTTLTHYWYKHFIKLSHFFHPFRPLNLKLRFLCCGCDRFTLQRFKMSSSGPVEMSECGFKTGYTARCRETWETQIPSKNHSHMKNNPKMYCL